MNMKLMVGEGIKKASVRPWVLTYGFLKTEKPK
jgi:hypothetical protein